MCDGGDNGGEYHEYAHYSGVPDGDSFFYYKHYYQRRSDGRLLFRPGPKSPTYIVKADTRLKLKNAEVLPVVIMLVMILVVIFGGFFWLLPLFPGVDKLSQGQTGALIFGYLLLGIGISLAICLWLSERAIQKVIKNLQISKEEIPYPKSWLERLARQYPPHKIPTERGWQIALAAFVVTTLMFAVAFYENRSEAIITYELVLTLSVLFVIIFLTLYAAFSVNRIFYWLIKRKQTQLGLRDD